MQFHPSRPRAITWGIDAASRREKRNVQASARTAFIETNKNATEQPLPVAGPPQWHSRWRGGYRAGAVPVQLMAQQLALPGHLHLPPLPLYDTRVPGPGSRLDGGRAVRPRRHPHPDRGGRRRDWDNIQEDHITEDVRRAAAKRIMMLPIPARDPVTGQIMQEWIDAPSSVDAGLNDFRDGLDAF